MDPDVVVTAPAAQAIGLALNELATNAMKYGALSVAEGRIIIFWTFDSDEPEPRPLLLQWTEQGGPAVTPPTHKSFGHMVIHDMIARSLNGEVELAYAPQGLTWVVSIPVANLVNHAS